VKTPGGSTLGVALLFLALFALRALHPTADPPVDLDWSGGIFFDEGMLVHGARNKILFGSWDLDEWNDFYLSPILTYIKWAVLSVAGVGIAQERLIPLGFSFLTLIVFYLALKESFDRKTAVVGLFLLGFNYIFLMFNRLGLTETPVTFFMVLTAYLWQKGFGRAGGGPAADRLRPGTFFLAGVSGFLAYVFKNFPHFLQVPLVAMLLAFRAQPAPALGARPAARRVTSAVLCLVGILVPFLVWYLVFYRRYAASITQAMSYFQYQSVPAHLEQLLINVVSPPFFDYFARTPVALLFSVAGVAYVVHLSFNDRERLRPLDLFMACWYVAHFLVYIVLTYRPVRYFVPVIPPMCALAARVMVASGSARAATIPRRLSIASMPVLAAWLTLLVGYGLFPLLARRGLLSPLTWERRMLAAAVGSALIVAAAAVVCRLAGGRARILPRHAAAVAFVAVPLAVTLVVEGHQYAQWALDPHHVIRDVSHELGRTLDHAVIAGLGAPMVVLENRHRALHVYERFFNFRDTFDRFPVTHLFMGAFNQEVDFYYRAYPAEMQRATLLRVYPIKDSHFYLYSLEEPSVERVAAVKETYGPHEEVRVTLAVRNNDRTDPRPVRPGWVLHPVAGGSPDVTVTAPAPLTLAPGETREIAVAAEVPPGRYRLMAFAGPASDTVFEGEFLVHRIGERRSDPAAANGLAWKVLAADPHQGHAVLGPYLRYPPGHVKATFRLKTADNTSALPVALIDIAAEAGRRMVAQENVRGLDFRMTRAYQEFELSGFLESPQVLEFRVGSYKRADLWIDRIRVEFTRGTWSERPITVAAVR
jgi:4-amino-4-deoxy-L-arabinose transferase-like glycosyltransferase